MRLPLYGRILVILGVSLLLASIVAEAYGAKTSTSAGGTVALGAAKGLAIYAMSLGGEGRLELRVSNAQTVYYIANISGDIGTLMGSLRVFNISAFNSQTIHDVRAGLVYGHATLRTSRFLLAALPGIAKMLHFSIKQVRVVNGEATVKAMLKPGEGILVVVIPRGDSVAYKLDYHVVGYRRLGLGASLAVSCILVGLGLASGLPFRRRSYT
ncbi:MAG: hypothetical protein GSR73_00240 [Desulfurococcales archaeon]|nr:hypothetical protein [Desulfurococcales archaeon]